MSKIDAEVVKSWIESKDLSYRSASNYLSELNKVADHFSFDRNDIKELRTEFKETLRENILESRAYSQQVLDRVELNEKMQVAFELQKEYGLRVSEASHINIEKQLDGNTLHYQQKGGMWSQKEISQELADKIRENATNGKFNVSVRTYERHLKAEIEAKGAKWHGTHGIRHSFAQQKLAEGYSKAEVSAMMGHVREEITNTYLR
jgi:integrase